MEVVEVEVGRKRKKRGGEECITRKSRRVSR
jgi:hypothetical protein